MKTRTKVILWHIWEGAKEGAVWGFITGGVIFIVFSCLGII